MQDRFFRKACLVGVPWCSGNTCSMIHLVELWSYVFRCTFPILLYVIIHQLNFITINLSIRSINQINQSVKLTPHQTLSHYMPLPRSCWIALGNRNSAISVWPKFVNRLPCSISASCDFLQKSPPGPLEKDKDPEILDFFWGICTWTSCDFQWYVI